jgi:hypothetical protein
MPRFPVLFLMLLAFGLSAATTHAGKPKKTTCKEFRIERSGDKYPPCPKAVAEPQLKNPGFAEVTAFVEGAAWIQDICVRIDGKTVGTAPLLATPVPPGTRVIQAYHNDIGASCQEVEIRTNDVSKALFRFVPEAEGVTQAKSKEDRVQRYGSIVVRNGFGVDAAVFVEPKGQASAIRKSKGTGSLKVSKLISGQDYVVEVERRGKDGKPSPVY